MLAAIPGAQRDFRETLDAVKSRCHAWKSIRDPHVLQLPRNDPKVGCNGVPIGRPTEHPAWAGPPPPFRTPARSNPTVAKPPPSLQAPEQRERPIPTAATTANTTLLFDGPTRRMSLSPWLPMVFGETIGDATWAKRDFPLQQDVLVLLEYEYGVGHANSTIEDPIPAPGKSKRESFPRSITAEVAIYLSSLMERPQLVEGIELVRDYAGATEPPAAVVYAVYPGPRTSLAGAADLTLFADQVRQLGALTYSADITDANADNELNIQALRLGEADENERWLPVLELVEAVANDAKVDFPAAGNKTHRLPVDADGNPRLYGIFTAGEPERIKLPNNDNVLAAWAKSMGIPRSKKDMLEAAQAAVNEAGEPQEEDPELKDDRTTWSDFNNNIRNVLTSEPGLWDSERGWSHWPKRPVARALHANAREVAVQFFHQWLAS